MSRKTKGEGRATLLRAHRRYLQQQDPLKKQIAGDDLIRAIFGADAIAKSRDGRRVKTADL